jgi:hypothetical protein
VYSGSADLPSLLRGLYAGVELLAIVNLPLTITWHNSLVEYEANHLLLENICNWKS